MELVVGRLLRWSLKSLPIPLSVPSCGRTCNLLLTNRIWQRWKIFEDAIKVPIQLTLKGEYSRWLWPSQKILSVLPWKKRLKAADSLSCWPGRGSHDGNCLCGGEASRAEGLSCPAARNWISSTTWRVKKSTPSSTGEHSPGDNFIVACETLKRGPS